MGPRACVGVCVCVCASVRVCVRVCIRVAAAPTAYSPDKSLRVVQETAPAFSMGKPRRARATDYLRF